MPHFSSFFTLPDIIFLCFYWTWVFPCRLLTHALMLSKHDWCYSGFWRCQFNSILDVDILDDVDDEASFGNSLVKIRELKFGREFETEFSICRTWCFFKILEKQLVKIFKLNLAQDFEAEVLSRFWGWSLIKIPKLKFGRYSEAKFWCYLKAVTLVKGLYPRVRCALALF